jgi:hypothetical protein
MQRKPVKRSKLKSRKVTRRRETLGQDTLVSLKKKLNPSRFAGMSPKMAAIVGYIIGEKYTHPYIESMVSTSDGAILARETCDFGYNVFIGSTRDLWRNWSNLCAVAELNFEELELARLLYLKKIKGVEWGYNE